MLRRNFATAFAVLLAAFLAPAVWSQTVIQDNFTGGNSSYNWATFSGACLTAGDGTGTIPACSARASYYNETLVGGYSGTLPDPVGNGALRFTNGSPGGFQQKGAIVSNFTFPTGQGLQVTFTTLTYRGNSGGNGGSGTVNANDGADGISFFLMDGTQPPGVGSTGGSLAYSCSDTNKNPTYDGLVGGYIGLGIDEFGNFLNQSDNTASGYGLQAGRIGLRGAGNVAWSSLNAQFGSQYFTGSAWASTANQQTAVQNTCKNGYLYDYNGNAIKNSSNQKIPVPDYAPITNAYKVLPSGVVIANESAVTRGQALPIQYNLKITQDGLLSLSYSYNGGTFQPVITSQSITTANGALPASFRFGFAGSTGGSTNIHELLCFKATPAESALGSGGVNVYQNPTIKTGTQLFLANYFPSNWSGQLTAQNILFDTTLNTVTIAPTPTWDARCVLTGVSTTTGACSTGATNMTAEDWKSARVMMSWNGTQGVPFEWSSTPSGTTLTAAQQTALDLGDASQGPNRLNYLRGYRLGEVNSASTCTQLASPALPCFRARVSVLGDIVDSSPAWVGPPGLPYTMSSWVDALYPTSTGSTYLPENFGQSYTGYETAGQGRVNVVYVGANDGFLHGFRAGSLNSDGSLNSATPNDGLELMAYMPGATLQSAYSSSTASPTQSLVQNIHGVTPANGGPPATAAAVTPDLDFSNTQYVHNFFVDATPATGDVFYNGVWHTWLVSGLGPGGAAIFALDITDPSQFAESNASSLVLGEWTPASLSCATSTTVSGAAAAACGMNLGNTYGTPLIRRFHNGQWGVIFGNGYNSQNGTAGIYIMLISASGSPKFYYLPTSSAATGNGIASTTSLDIDSDHVVDYIYAGDLLGNVWRFDVTDQNPANWQVSASSPLFTTPAGQPITTALTVGTLRSTTTLLSLGGSSVSTNAPERVIINFGTGRLIPQTITSPASYASGSQYLYGIWDWDMQAWTTKSPSQPALYLTGSNPIQGPGSSTPNLQQQTVTTVPATGSALAYRSVSQNPVCWKAAPGNQGTVPALPASCTSATMLGWYLMLPGAGEQVIFDPALSVDGEFVVNTYIPASTSPLSCTSGTSTGFSMGLQPDSGGGSPTPYFYVNTNLSADGVQLNGTGVPSFVTSGQKGDNNSEYFVTQTGGGVPAAPTKVNRHAVVTGQRLNWIQRR